MSLVLIANIVACGCAFIGFVYGVLKFFRPKKAVYAQMITLSVGCMALGRLYQVVRLLTVGDIFVRFQLGILGVIGSLLFLFSANFGMMDSLADDGSKKYSKYRIIPLAAPAVYIAAYLVFFLFSDCEPLVKIAAGILTVFVSGSSYFNLKHLIFPDVDFGVIKSLKLYNILALAFAALCVIEMIAVSRGSDAGILITSVLFGLTLLAITPTVERGIKRWTT